MTDTPPKSDFPTIIPKDFLDMMPSENSYREMHLTRPEYQSMNQCVIDHPPLMSSSYAEAEMRQQSFHDIVQRQQLNILQHLAVPMMVVTFDEEGKKYIDFADGKKEIIEKKKTFWENLDLE
jgi:hypothetical protein